MRLQAGEPALLIDSKGRQFLLKLESGHTFSYHNGSVEHDELIGADEGTWVISTGGARMLLLRPRLADFVLRMKRGAQVVYPKDLGPILVYGDIGPGMTVLEAGTGSGALTLGLARAVGPEGRVISVERREDHAARAHKNVKRWFGEIPANVELKVGEVVDEVAGLAPQRVVLDLPEPWAVLDVLATHMPDGGILCVYLPTVPQVQTTVERARELGRFTEFEIMETMVRDWNVDGRSVRPEHSMVGHTGFLTFMRKVADVPLRAIPEN